MKHSLKKIVYILATVALIFTALSTVRYGDGEGPREVEVLGAEVLSSVETFGCELEVTSQGVVITPHAEGAYFILPLNGQPYNLVSIRLAEPYAEDVQIYVHDYPNETVTAKSYRADGGKTLYFNLPTQEGDTGMRVDVLLPMTVESITTLCITGTPVPLVWNPAATVMLAVLLLLLLALERWLGYFVWMRNAVRREIDRVSALWRQGRRAMAILYAAAQVLTAMLVLMVGVFIWLGVYSKATVYTTFGVALAALALQLLRQCFLCERVEPAKLFLTVAILVGLVMIYSMPPVIFVSWDDQIHYWQAYEVPNLLDPNMTLAESRLYTHHLLEIDRFAKDPDTFVYALVQGDNIVVEHEPYMPNPYTAFGYIPMSIAIGILSLANADMVTLMVLCRYANLLAYAFIVYFGIRKLRSGAYIFSSICLLPTAVFLASTCNYDFWLTAWVAYGFASVLSVLQVPERKFQKSELIKILIAFFLACGPKAVYFFLLTPLLFLPSDRFETPRAAKKFRKWTLLTIGLIFLLLLIPMFVLPGGYTDTRGGEDVSSSGQIAFILSNPIRYAGILLKFLGRYCSLEMLNLNSTYMGYLGGPHAFFGTLAGFLLLYCAFTDRCENDGYETMTRVRWVTLLACFCQVVLVATSLYVGFTPVGHDTVNGCQYRYLFPIFLPFFFFLAPKGIKCRINQRLQGVLVYGALALNVLITFSTIYLSTFYHY